MIQYNPDELFQLQDGRCIASPVLSRRMAYIKSVRPESSWQEDSTPYTWDHMGMAALFSECYMDDTRYCPYAKSWYTYTESGVWAIDSGAVLVNQKAKEFVRLMSLYCGEIPFDPDDDEDDIRKKYLAFVAKMGTRSFREQMIKDAADEMVIDAAEFDANPMLINCKNGTYDLETMTFRHHDPADFLTHQTNFDFTIHRDVTCPRWEQFIDEITQGDKDKADFLQRALGYSMLGRANEECMFILHGKTTRNGKSTLLNTVERLLGDYSTAAPVELICRTDRPANAESANPVLASLKGKRFVTMAENDNMGRLDESTIKRLTGGEAITARKLYQEPITYTPQFTIWLSCNDLPAICDKSLFASQRIHLVEFNRHFSQEEQDKGLKDYFLTPDAARGIFMWMLRGLQMYRRRGLVTTSELLKPVESYERDNDLILQFLEQKCSHSEGAVTPKKDLYARYKIWCKSNGYRPFSIKKFLSELLTHPEWVTDRDRESVEGLRLV